MNTLVYHETWSSQLLDDVLQSTLTNMFVQDVDFLMDGNGQMTQTFHKKSMQVSGFKPGNRSMQGVQRGTITEQDNTFTLTFKREIEFAIEASDERESPTATMENVHNKFMMTQFGPEMDSFFFSKVATTAIALGGKFATQTAHSSYTKTNIYETLVSAISAIKEYRMSSFLFLDSDLMDLLEQAPDFTRTIEILQIGPEGSGLNTKVTAINGTPLIEVIDLKRFHTEFDYSEGFTPAIGSYGINILIATPQTATTVVQIRDIFLFIKSQHTQGNGSLYQNFAVYDTWIFPNGKNNLVDSIYIDYDTIAET